MYVFFPFLIHISYFLGITSLWTTGDDASRPCVTTVRRQQQDAGYDTGKRVRQTGRTNDEGPRHVKRRVLGLMYVFFF